MGSILRGVMAVIAGSLAAMAAMVVCESMGHAIFPPPPGLDFSKPGAMEEYARGMRSVEFLPVLVGWGVGSLIGASVAAKLASGWKMGCGMIVGAIFLAAGVANMVMIPHPIWVWVAGLALFPTMAFVGATLGSAGSIGTPAPREVALDS